MRGFLLKLFRRRRLEDELETELAFHRQMAAERGDHIPLGNAAVIKEDALDLWRFVSLENIWRDVRYAVRSLRRSRALVASALLSLALGIGVNTAMFSLAVEFLLSEPSVTDASSIVSIQLGGNSHAQQDAIEFLRENGVFREVTGENDESFINWNDGTETRTLFGVFTTQDYFTALGVPMAYGRGFLSSDPREVTVLRYQFWRKHFNGDPSVVGRSINLDGKAYTVVGILPEGHRTLIGFGFAPDLYLPKYLDDTLLAIYARMKPGMTVAQAQAATAAVAERLDTERPAPWKYGRNSKVTPLAGFARLKMERQALSIGLFFLLLLGVVGLVLLIACINVASLLLARASARKQEIAIRLALGAGRGRLLQQLLIESLLLSIAGAICGFFLAQITASLLARIHLPLPLPIQLQIEPDWRVASYAALLAIFSTVACGLIPAWQSVREAISTNIRRDNRFRLRRVLVSVQVAVSVVVLATGFLFLRNLLASNAISPGFDVRNTVRARVTLPPVTYANAAKKKLFVEQTLRELRALPGVQAAAAARIIPFTDSTRNGTDLTFADNGTTIHVLFHWNAVSPDYFRAMDIPIRQGHEFSEQDRGEDESAVVVNRTFVERYLAKREPLGARFYRDKAKRTAYHVVGVAEDTKNLTLGEDPAPQLYESLTQFSDERPRIQFVLRSATPAAQVPAMRDVFHRIEPAAGIEVATMYSSIGLAFLPSQVGAALMGSIGVLGLLLAGIGLYGVMIYSVARRSREIGVRMAIGAGRGDIRRMILGEAARLLVTGVAVGLSVAIFVTRPLAQFLVPGLKPGDPVTLFSVVVVLVLCGLCATWSPIRRALAIDPMTSLRYE